MDSIQCWLVQPIKRAWRRNVSSCIFWLWIYFTSSSEGVQDWNTVWRRYDHVVPTRKNISLQVSPDTYHHHHHMTLQRTLMSYSLCWSSEFNQVEFSTVSAGFYWLLFISRMFHNHKYQFSSTVFSSNIGTSAQLHCRRRCCIVLISYIYRIIFKIKTKTFFLSLKSSFREAAYRVKPSDWHEAPADRTQEGYVGGRGQMVPMG